MYFLSKLLEFFKKTCIPIYLTQPALSRVSQLLEEIFADSTNQNRRELTSRHHLTEPSKPKAARIRISFHFKVYTVSLFETSFGC